MDEWALILNDRIIKRFSIDEGDALTIGRGAEANIVVDNAAISREHCTIELKNGVYYLTDLYSLNGTKVNGTKIESAVPIKKTDFIEVSKFTLQPAEDLSAKESPDIDSVSTDDGLDRTMFVAAKSIHRPENDRYKLRIISGKGIPSELDLTSKDSVKVGKDDSCDVVISGFLLGSTQFFITKRADNFTLIPLGVLRRTYLNGKLAKGEIALKRDDEIETCGIVFKVE